MCRKGVSIDPKPFIAAEPIHGFQVLEAVKDNFSYEQTNPEFPFWPSGV